MTMRFIDVMLRQATIGQELHARLLQVVHLCISQGDTLGVTWPDFAPDVPSEFGLLFRVFGDQDALAHFGSRVKALEDAALVRSYPIQIAPVTDSKILFARDRRLDKVSPTRARRMERRATARGEVFIPTASKFVPKHYLWMQSATTQQRFCLAVTCHRQREDNEENGGRQYGLGCLLPNF